MDIRFQYLSFHICILTLYGSKTRKYKTASIVRVTLSKITKQNKKKLKEMKGRKKRDFKNY